MYIVIVLKFKGGLIKYNIQKKKYLWGIFGVNYYFKGTHQIPFPRAKSILGQQIKSILGQKKEEKKSILEGGRWWFEFSLKFVW